MRALVTKGPDRGKWVTLRLSARAGEALKRLAFENKQRKLPAHRRKTWAQQQAEDRAADVAYRVAQRLLIEAGEVKEESQ